MTPDQIEEAAIEAAGREVTRAVGDVDAGGNPIDGKEIARAAIRAYEAEKPKPVKIDRLMDAQWHSVDVNSARVRLFGDKGILDTPLPKPPEEKT